MPAIRIDRAGPNDIAAIKSVEIECGLSPWTSDGYESELVRPDAVALVARTYDGKVGGFIIGRISNAAEGVAEIYNIGTIPGYQRRGIGKSLLIAFLEICEKRRVPEVWLEARSSNHAALGFYRSNGFEVNGIRRNFYENPSEDAQLLSLKVPLHPELTKS